MFCGRSRNTTYIAIESNIFAVIPAKAGMTIKSNNTAYPDGVRQAVRPPAKESSRWYASTGYGDPHTPASA